MTNPNGVLVASAGRDLNLIGAVVGNAGTGATSLSARNDINLGTVRETTVQGGRGTGYSASVIASREVGSIVTGGGDVTMKAGHDVLARAATVAAGGNLNVNAANDLRIETGRSQSDLSYSAQ